MEEQQSRTRLILGDDAVEKLKKAHVVLLGLGGVGSYTAEALARAGVGALTIIDGDDVAVSNINRQLPALRSTVGKKKALVVADRIKDIDPEIKVNAMPIFYNEETAESINFDGVTYLADAIDMVSSKILAIEKAKEKGVSVISCMGAGNKLDPTLFEVADIEKTSVCPLAKVVRLELRKRGIKGVKAVFSKELPVKKEKPVGSVSFVPSVAGLIMAGEIIKDITKNGDR